MRVYKYGVRLVVVMVLYGVYKSMVLDFHLFCLNRVL